MLGRVCDDTCLAVAEDNSKARYGGNIEEKKKT